ncbi:PCDAB protein, partial [Casuarius casuarius]|nr:PCDAB protein [Casuarius casuarius]
VVFTASSLFPASGRDRFVLDSSTGEVKLSGPLDFEDVRLYEIQVEAKDRGAPPLSGHCKVVVEVLDVND